MVPTLEDPKCCGTSLTGRAYSSKGSDYAHRADEGKSVGRGKAVAQPHNHHQTAPRALVMFVQAVNREGDNGGGTNRSGGEVPCPPTVTQLSAVSDRCRSIHTRFLLLWEGLLSHDDTCQRVGGGTFK